MAIHIKGDLLIIQVDVIVQQCNCLTVRPYGLSSSIASKLDVNLYKYRKSMGKKNLAIPEDRGTPGQCIIFATNVNGPKYVACLLAQFAPGKAKCYHSEITQQHGYVDSYDQREQWFQQSLNHLKVFVINYSFKTIAFPFAIGCGLAGGNWKNYAKMIDNFAKDLTPKGVKVYVVKLLK
jgi:O-acetyl-ADP-ribose deacetylase (regulator of RNase III)